MDREKYLDEMQNILDERARLGMRERQLNLMYRYSLIEEMKAMGIWFHEDVLIRGVRHTIDEIDVDAAQITVYARNTHTGIMKIVYSGNDFNEFLADVTKYETDITPTFQ